MKKFSLKLRLIISFFLVASGIWGGSTILSWYESREYVDEFFDTYQLLLARQLSTADWTNINPGTQKRVNHIIEELDDDGDDEDESLGFAVFNKDGEMIFNDDEDGKSFDYAARGSGFKNQPAGSKGKLWRIIWVKSIDGDFTIAVGQELKYRKKAAIELVEEAVVPWLVGLIIMLGAIIILVSRELKPLKKIAHNLVNRSPNDFSPLVGKDVPQEITPLMDAINNLFARIDEMLKRERSFIADSAHELRSPLTALKVQLEVAELAYDDKEAHAKALHNVGQGIERASRLVEQLLALSRLESNGFQSDEEKEILDWKKIIETSVDEQKETAKSKDISIETSLSEQGLIPQGKSMLWSLLMRNLLDNAIRYSAKGSTIKIELTPNELKVSNNGVSLDKKHLNRLGERFFRPAGQQVSGSGLGLSIIEKIAELHQCRANYDCVDDTFIVTISRQ